jgi:ADP-ribose pyrophosphatase YjhB (NUDIX family)
MADMTNRTAAGNQVARRVPSAGAIVFDAAGRLLLIKRARPPAAGSWSLPGGRCRPGESSERACVRELSEETGLDAHVLRHAGRVERAGHAGTVYDIDDFVCEITGGTLRAGDDAADARWVDAVTLDSLELAPQLAATLRGWGLLPG